MAVRKKARRRLARRKGGPLAGSGVFFPTIIQARSKVRIQSMDGRKPAEMLCVRNANG